MIENFHLSKAFPYLMGMGQYVKLKLKIPMTKISVSSPKVKLAGPLGFEPRAFSLEG
jgi:hypothetical protein